MLESFLDIAISTLLVAGALAGLGVFIAVIIVVLMSDDWRGDD